MKIHIPKVEIPEQGLTDVFLDVMAQAMETTPEEVKTILHL